MVRGWRTWTWCHNLVGGELPINSFRKNKFTNNEFCVLLNKYDGIFFSVWDAFISHQISGWLFTGSIAFPAIA